MKSRPLIIGTRGSTLALAQTRHVIKSLQEAHPGLDIREKIIKTRGDQRLDVSLSATGPLDKGLFTRELENALRRGQIDAAVHSLKDLPVEMPRGFALGAILPREDPADVLILKPGHTPGLVATSSPRRALQLALTFPGVEIREIRGNVPTRLRKLQEDRELDGIVLALAGLKRLGFCDFQGHWLAEELSHLELRLLPEMLPAPGQGAVAVQIRSANGEIGSVLPAVHCEETARCVTAERALLTVLGGGCHLALGARAVWHKRKRKAPLRMRAVFFPGEDPARVLWGEAAGVADDPVALAASLASQWRQGKK